MFTLFYLPEAFFTINDDHFFWLSQQASNRVMTDFWKYWWWWCFCSETSDQIKAIKRSNILMSVIFFILWIFFTDISRGIFLYFRFNKKRKKLLFPRFYLGDFCTCLFCVASKLEKHLWRAEHKERDGWTWMWLFWPALYFYFNLWWIFVKYVITFSHFVQDFFMWMRREK